MPAGCSKGPPAGGLMTCPCSVCFCMINNSSMEIKNVLSLSHLVFTVQITNQKLTTVLPIFTNAKPLPTNKEKNIAFELN